MQDRDGGADHQGPHGFCPEAETQPAIQKAHWAVSLRGRLEEGLEARRLAGRLVWWCRGTE